MPPWQTLKYGYDTHYDRMSGSSTNRTAAIQPAFGFDDIDDDKKNTVDIIATERTPEFQRDEMNVCSMAR